MLIGSESVSLDLYAKVVEPDTNNEATKYIIDNYNELVILARKLNIKEEKAQDLVHDVYISIAEAEANGEGFDMEFGSKYDDDGKFNCELMDVGQFVRGRIKRYAQNDKYRSDVVEIGKGTIVETSITTEIVTDMHGQAIIDKNGNPKTCKKVEKVKKNIKVATSAASFEEAGDIVDNNDKFQLAYAKAAVGDTTDDVTELLSLREQIDYCIDVCELHGINILNVFKNMDLLSSMLNDYPRRKKSFDSVFSKLHELVSYHTEFGETLMNVLTYSSTNRSAFETIIASY